jgi:predicted metal-dependent hydrolase
MFFGIRKRTYRRRTKRVSQRHYREHKAHAREVIVERLQYWNERIGVSYGRVCIRNQSSRWGSCSSIGNLNFNYRIAFLPTELLDYVIVHELCHRIEFNHSSIFWSHVESVLHDYQLRKDALSLLHLEKVPFSSYE